MSTVENKKPRNLRAGHRKRMRTEFLENGITPATPPHRILEFLLHYCVVQKDTNVLAHEMYEKYGSVSGVLDAPIEELMEFKGVSDRGAAMLKMLRPIAKYCDCEDKIACFEFDSTEKICEYMVSQFHGVKNERLGMLLIDSMGRKKDFLFVAEGDMREVLVPLRKIVQLTVNRNAAVVIIAHNHPGSTAVPSDEDLAVTIKLKNLLADVGVRLYDHIVISENDYVSLKSSMCYKDIFDDDDK